MSIEIVSAAIKNVDANIVRVEVDISKGMPSFNVVGMVDTAVKESKERVRAALINSGFDFPLGRITVSLAPANIKKVGSLFDLPIAIGILTALGYIAESSVENYMFFGELSLNGEIRGVRGALALAIEGVTKNHSNIIVPNSNKDECSLVYGAKITAF